MEAAGGGGGGKRRDWHRAGASERPGDPTRSALNAGRWQLSILPHPDRGEPDQERTDRPGGIFSGYYQSE